MNVTGIGGKELQKSYRQKLKTRSERTYGDKIMFLSPEYHSTPIVIGKECLNKRTLSSSVKKVKKEADDIIRKVVKDKTKKIPDLNWPSTVEQLDVGDRNPPDIVFNFYKRLLFGYETHQYK